MQLSQDQIRWAQSYDPRDAARLRGSLGIDENAQDQSGAGWDIYHQINNFFGPGGGGNGYDPNNGPMEWSPDGNWHSIVGANGQFAQPAGVAAGAPGASGGARPAGGSPAGGAVTPYGGGTRGGDPTAPANSSGTPAGGGTGVAGISGTTNAAQYTNPNYGTYQAPTRPADASTPWDFFNDKGYQFALNEAKNLAENSAAARGGLNSGATLKELSDRAAGMASQYYNDAYNRWMGNKQFAEGQFNSDRNFGLGQFNGDRAFQYGADTNARDYNNANRQWDASFNRAGDQWDRSFARAGDQWDRTFDNNNRIDARNFDYQAALGDRNFNEDQRRYDQGFNYTANNNDANRNLQTLQYLAGLGSNANNNSSNFYAQLAQMLSGNLLTGAGAGAAGNQGGANSLVSLFSALAPYLMGSGYPMGNAYPTGGNGRGQ